MKRVVKKVILRLGRPIWKRLSPGFYARIDRRIDTRLAETDKAWKQHAPAFLNAISTVSAYGRELAHQQEELTRMRDEAAQTHGETQAALTETQAALTETQAALTKTREGVAKAHERVEFVRSEILYEMRYGRTLTEATRASVQPRVLNPEKLATAEATGVRLNVGCGHLPLDGYINVDMRDLPGVDIIAEAGDLPFTDRSVSELYSAHLLEHFPQEDLVRRLLPYWHGLLIPNGLFRAIVPDGEAMLAHLADGTYLFEDFREVLFGAQDYVGDTHYNLLTPTSLTRLLEEGGFHNIHVGVAGRRNGKCFEFEIEATKSPSQNLTNGLTEAESGMQNESLVRGS